MMITLQTEADQSDLAIVDTLKPQTQTLEHSCLHTSSGDEKMMITLQTETDQSDLAIVGTGTSTITRTFLPTYIYIVQWHITLLLTERMNDYTLTRQTILKC